MIPWEVELEVDGTRQTFRTRRVDDEHYELSFGSSRRADVVIDGIAATECSLVVNDVGYTWLRDRNNETRRLAVNEAFTLGGVQIRMTRTPTCNAGAWRLKLRVGSRGGFEAREAVFLKPEVIIGRTGAADLVLDTCNASRKHCKLDIDEAGVVWISDLGSTNGTWVSGQRVAERRPFELGDKLIIGEFAIELGEPPRRVPA